MSPLDSQLTGGVQRVSRPNVARAKVARAPADETSPLAVYLANYSRTYEYEIPPENWVIPGLPLPQVKDMCVVVFDDDGDIWVANWASLAVTNVPEGPAGGDLTGTYPNPTIGAGKVDASRISATLKPSGGAVAGTEALRALGTSSSTAAAGNDTRLSDSRAPSGPAGGVLAGTYPNPAFAADMATQAELDAAVATIQQFQTGDFKYSIQSADHTGWLLADGRAITVAMGFTALRALLVAAANPFGVSGSDPRLPDIRGRVVMGAGTGAIPSALTARVLGATPGSETHTLTTPEIPAHSHGHNLPAQAWFEGGGARGGNAGTLQGNFANLVISNAGGGGAHNNVQPSLALHPFIKT